MPRALPIVYFATGHCCLLAACLVVALDPQPFAVTMLLPRVVAVVHLVTLGWITTSILGATYIVAPMALAVPLSATRADGWACAGVLIAASGVISHFWLAEYSGIAWSGGILLLACGTVTAKVLAALRRAKGTPAPLRAHIALAYVNLMVAILLGTWLAFCKTHPEWLAHPLDALIAHAHVAAVGWAVMIAVGVGHRLLPMFLPAAPPTDRTAWTTVCCLQGGVGLAVAGFWLPAALPFAAIGIVLGIGVFAGDVVRMLRQRRPPPRALRRPDPGALQALFAITCLVVAAAIGLWLALDPTPRPRWTAAYGGLALVGFLSQLILGIGQRLFPLFAWRRQWDDNEHRTLPPSPHTTPVRGLQVGQFAAWLIGVPALTAGLASASPAWISAAGWALAAGTAMAAVNTAVVLRART